VYTNGLDDGHRQLPSSLRMNSTYRMSHTILTLQIWRAWLHGLALQHCSGNPHYRWVKFRDAMCPWVKLNDASAFFRLTKERIRQFW